jgi:N-acetyltransferase
MALEHLDGLCAVGLEPELWRWTPAAISSRADMKTYIETALKSQAEGTALPFATTDRSTGTIIGSTRYGAIDRPNRRLEIGWTWIGTRWQRTAANTEAKYLMLRQAFENLRCHRVEFKTDLLNERSRTALLRIGAKQEGVLRQHMITASGRLRDTVYYSVIHAEWPEVKDELEKMLARRLPKADTMPS